MTRPREEERAEQHLLNQEYELFRPLVREYKIRKGKQVPVTESLFPRYLFILLDDVLSNWASIRSTRGVAGLVRFAEMPAVVPDEIIVMLRSHCNDEGIIDTTQERPFVYKEGDEVEITEGSFRGIRAIIKVQVAEDRVLLLLDLLGKKQQLEVSIGQIKSGS
jgi:transcriptional antiterminator RfaH